MEQTAYASRLRYLDAADVEDGGIDFDGLKVLGSTGDRIGSVDGFVLDPQAGRVYYLVVDSGGWFRSRRFLLPIGHAALAADRKALHADLTKDALSQYPDFDEDRFTRFTDVELEEFERRMGAACCPEDALQDVSVGSFPGYEGRRHYTQPDWWERRQYSGERLRPLGPRPYRERDIRAVETTAPSRDRFEREAVIAREDTGREPSPHFGGRAQPGDVLGIETGGERSSVGDTAEDENKRRVDAERAALDEDRESER